MLVVKNAKLPTGSAAPIQQLPDRLKLACEIGRHVVHYFTTVTKCDNMNGVGVMLCDVNGYGD